MPRIAQELEINRLRNGLPGPAFVSPQAIIGDNVYLGPGCRIHEFSTIRDGSIIDADATVGYGNEIVRSYIGRGSEVAHRNTVTASLLGQSVYLTSGVTIGSVTFRNVNGLNPDDLIFVTMPDGSIYNTGTAKFGAVLGDGVRVSMHAALGPGVIVGQNSILGSSVRLSSGLYPSELQIRDVHRETVQSYYSLSGENGVIENPSIGSSAGTIGL